ncbi:MAG TPA: hypothetical protein VGO55_01980 [Allosphingosinicella sp.]|jgi:hypothetical protein|nr:hypothetical protein [Allosphingosinicella sp.]
MLAALLLLAAAPATNVHSARVPSLDQVRTAIAARGSGTRLRVSDERCSPMSVPRRERPRIVAAARCSFRYGEAALADPAARPARWRRQHAYFYLTGAPCGGDGQGSDLTCYSWTVDRVLIVSGAEAP